MDENWDDDSPVQGHNFQNPYTSYEPEKRAFRDDYDRNDKYNNNAGQNNRETFQIQGNQVGAIIGKGGSNIKNYEAKFNVKVNVDKSSNEVTISGDSPDDVSNAVNCIQSDLRNRSDNRRDGSFGRNR